MTDVQLPPVGWRPNSALNMLLCRRPRLHWPPAIAEVVRGNLPAFQESGYPSCLTSPTTQRVLWYESAFEFRINPPPAAAGDSASWEPTAACTCLSHSCSR